MDVTLLAVINAVMKDVNYLTSDKLTLFNSKNKTAHIYIHTALKIKYIPPIIVNWLVSNFAMTRIKDIIQDEMERLQ